MKQKQALLGATVFTGESFVEGCAVILCENLIEGLIPQADVSSECEKIYLEGGILAPGFMDLQVNGGGGAFFTNDTSVAALQTMLDGHRPSGTTSMLPTLISDTRAVHQAGVHAVVEAINLGVKGILGVHIEGPFFALTRRGAHNERYIRTMEQADIDWLTRAAEGLGASNASAHLAPAGKIMLTLAPEHTAPGQIKTLVDAGLIVCAGHSDALYVDVVRALEEGLSGFTHLYNAMRPTTGREPGVVGAALENKDAWCGIIIDQHHVHAASARIAYAAKPQGKMYLVSDAMSTVGAEQKHFEIYGETIFEKNGCLVNAEGRLAGSAIGMIDAVRLNTEWLGVALSESLRMAALYPAQFMQLDNCLGRLQPGYRADLVHFTADYKVTHTWVAGAVRIHV